MDVVGCFTGLGEWLVGIAFQLLSVSCVANSTNRPKVTPFTDVISRLANVDGHFSRVFETVGTLEIRCYKNLQRRVKISNSMDFSLYIAADIFKTIWINIERESMASEREQRI